MQGAQSAQTIRDSADAVFRMGEFQPRLSVWWWTRYLPKLRIGDAQAETVAWVVLGVLVALAAAAITRSVLRARRAGTGAVTLAASSLDPWTRANQLASAGMYLEAAHCLFAGLIEALGGRGELRPHPSKTIGEYVRELRTDDLTRRGAVWGFLRLYERTVFGLTGCDLGRYEELRALAARGAGAGAVGGTP